MNTILEYQLASHLELRRFEQLICSMNILIVFTDRTLSKTIAELSSAYNVCKK